MASFTNTRAIELLFSFIERKVTSGAITSMYSNETYIDINQEWRGQISFSAHDKIKTNC